LINPVAEKFFRVQRQEIPFSVGRHSRDAEFKFPTDFFGLHESIRIGDLNAMILGAPIEMQQYVKTNLFRLKNNYLLLGFGSMRVPDFLKFPQIYLYQTREDFAETCPMNILEAMAAGIPVVAESKGGICSLLTHNETGILCTSTDQYVDSCHLLFDSAQERRRIGDAAQQWARENASLERFGEHFLQATSQLLSIAI
jgi:glycosyltransferase involved in cell wall biosynthesis